MTTSLPILCNIILNPPRYDSMVSCLDNCLSFQSLTGLQQRNSTRPSFHTSNPWEGDPVLWICVIVYLQGSELPLEPVPEQHPPAVTCVVRDHTQSYAHSTSKPEERRSSDFWDQILSAAWIHSLYWYNYSPLCTHVGSPGNTWARGTENSCTFLFLICFKVFCVLFFFFF